MNFDQNDPKWTAYLLNELAEADHKALEAELKTNPEAKKWLEEMREASSLFTTTFSHETEIGLKEEVKKEILTKSETKRRSLLILLPTLAAAAVVAISLASRLMLPKTTSPEVVFSESDVITPSNAQPSDIPQEFNEIYDPKKENADVGDEERKDFDAFGVGGTIGAIPSIELPKITPKLYEGIDELAPLEVKPAVMPSSGGRQQAQQPDSEPEEVELSEVKNLSRLMSDVSSPVVMSGLQMGRSSPSVKEAPKIISPSQDHFSPIESNSFRKVEDHPLSTFSIDVDTASYSVVRKFLNQGQLPPRDAVRIEELINYFPYSYEPPTDGEAFAVHMEVAVCPWAPEHPLVRIALKGKEISAEERPALNLVYLLDVSGSMNSQNKLPLVKRSLEALAKQLDERDRVAIVVYAGAAGLVLPSTSGEDSKAIQNALRQLSAGGSTAGGAGIQLAYKTARDQFVKGGVNRVILCTDGDFNVGMTQTGDLERLIEKEATSGIFLTILGFGMGNYKDSTLETLSNKGNGTYAYIDNFSEARKVLVDQMLGTLVTIAKDVKIQVEFNPAHVAGYRLIGYENRMLKKEDFNNDMVDAGEIGAGHTVTAFYELIPVGQLIPGEAPEVDSLRYQARPTDDRSIRNELLTLKFRHKQPDGESSVKREFQLMNRDVKDHSPSLEFTFASSVAAFGLWLREPEFREQLSIEQILQSAESGLGKDRNGYRFNFLELIRNAAALSQE